MKQNLYQVISGTLFFLYYCYNIKEGKMSNSNFSANTWDGKKKIGVKACSKFSYQLQTASVTYY